MTEKKRVFVNVIATYGRSLFAIACGLFSGRWCLMSLGEVDYGLYGVVGGLTGFIGFFNGLLADAVGRFYAYSVGQSKIAGGEGIEICRKWFNTALCVHTVVPVLLIAIGYPIGEWCVTSWLNIPPGRVDACVWVFRCVCIRCLVAMVNVPYRAMYTAKQYIAELTIYSVVETAFNVVFMYYMVTHPGVWLTRYAIWSCILFVVPEIIICIRARKVFDECRFKASYLFDCKRFKELFVFASYRLGGALCGIVGGQGITLMVNKMLGARTNAAMTVASTVSGHANTFSGSLSGAIYPVVTSACGANDYDKMRKWAFASCRLASFFTLIFALPLFIEVDTVMKIWLGNPPDGAALLCACTLVSMVCEGISSGHYMAVFSVGKIRGYQIACALNGLLVLPIGYLCVRLGLGVLGIGYASVVVSISCIIIRLYFGKTVGTLSPSYWMWRVFSPIAFSSAASLAVGVTIAHLFEPSFARVALTTACIEIVFLPMVWFVAFDVNERSLLQQRLLSRFNKYKGRK